MNYYDHVLQLGITAIIWACWCAIHSLLNSEGIVSKALPPGSRIRPYYRLLYSLFVAIALVIVGASIQAVDLTCPASYFTKVIILKLEQRGPPLVLQEKQGRKGHENKRR